MDPCKRFILLITVFFTVALFWSGYLFAIEENKGINISAETQACIACHSTYTPGIVEDWLTSRHAKTTPEQAFKLPILQRRISAEDIPDNLKKNPIGCYECHGLNPQAHKDNFDHFGFRINVVVSPNDCKTCHPVEVSQFSGSKKAYAIRNLMDNPVYHTLVDSIDGITRVEKGKLIQDKPSDKTLHETCLGCHGTKIGVKGMKKVSTELGEIEVPALTNWPNQGVGRENPDGSRGACTACHPRHSFSIEIARKPYTCGQCHLEPDVPAYNVYKESKHGNIYESKHREWNFGNVPWVVGKDFKSPTCATCHNSLLVSPDGNVIAERTHDFGSRLWVRLFGLIYSHPQPKSGDTTIIKNAEGLPLPTTFLGEPASEYLIDKMEQERRLTGMKAICNSCHSTDWIDGHFEKLSSTIKETDAMTLAATKLIIEAWDKGIADRTNPFDEAIEKLWIKQWLFYSNSIRYASAMTGAPDYTAFKLGWWELSDNLQRMRDMIDIKYDLLMDKSGGRKRLK